MGLGLLGIEQLIDRIIQGVIIKIVADNPLRHVSDLVFLRAAIDIIRVVSPGSRCLLHLGELALV